MKRSFFSLALMAILAMISTGLVGCGGSGSSSTDSVTASGKAIDGYLSGATVFEDEDGDGQLDSGEANTTTNSTGDWVLRGYKGNGPIVIYGGTDIQTKKAFTGVMKSPKVSRGEASSSKMNITPLTTMAQALIENDSTLSADAADTKVKQILGISSDKNLSEIDPIANTVSNSTSDEDKQLAVKLYSAAQMVQAIVEQTVATISGAAAQNSTGALTSAEKIKAASLALQQLASKLKDQDDSIDTLSESGVVKDIIEKTTAAANADSTLSAKVTAAVNATAVAAADTVAKKTVQITQNLKVIKDSGSSTTEAINQANAQAAASSEIADEVETAVSENKTSDIDSIDVDKKVQEEEEKIDPVEPDEPTIYKGYAFDDNRIMVGGDTGTYKSISTSGVIASATVTNDNVKMSFVLNNYTGSTGTTATTLNYSITDQSSTRNVEGKLTKVSFDYNDSIVTQASVAADAELSMTGTGASGNAVKVTLVNDVANADIIKSDDNSNIEINANTLLKLAQDKAKASNSTYVLIGDNGELAKGNYNYSLSFTGVTFGYENGTALTKTFASVSGTLVVQ